MIGLGILILMNGAATLGAASIAAGSTPHTDLWNLFNTLGCTLFGLEIFLIILLVALLITGRGASAPAPISEQPGYVYENYTAPTPQVVYRKKAPQQIYVIEEESEPQYIFLQQPAPTRNVLPKQQEAYVPQLEAKNRTLQLDGTGLQRTASGWYDPITKATFDTEGNYLYREIA